MSEDVKELVQSFGWKEVEEKLKEKKNSALKLLCGEENHLKVIRYQERIRAIDDMIRCPHQLIKEG